MEMNLAEIRTVIFELLKHFKQFCNENNIRFFLSNGTLLGAVKYGGFIPWDDDIDVLVPREDYDRLLALYQDTDHYRLLSREREEKFRFPFAKLCDMTTHKEETNIDNGIRLGLDIDIFPLDSCTMHICKASVQRRIKGYQIGCVLSKFKTHKGKPLLKQFIIRCCQKWGYDRFSKNLIKLVNRERVLGETHKGCLMWPIYGAQEVLPAEVFSDRIEVEYEGEKFPVPIGYDTYLRSLYGDYIQDPPLREQVTHHSFKAYRV